MDAKDILRIFWQVVNRTSLGVIELYPKRSKRVESQMLLDLDRVTMREVDLILAIAEYNTVPTVYLAKPTQFENAVISSLYRDYWKALEKALAKNQLTLEPIKSSTVGKKVFKVALKAEA